MLRIKINEEIREITMEELRKQIEQGILPSDTLVQSETIFGDGMWRALEKTTLYNRIKQEKEAEILQPETSVKTIQSVRYTGFWLRFAAFIIDIIAGSILYGIVTFLLNLFLPVVGFIISIIVTFIFDWLYYAIFESSSLQATIGKMAVGIIVTDLEGNQVSFGKASVRFWAKIISGIILSIGYIMAGFTEKKQALHDMIAGCLVVRK